MSTHGRTIEIRTIVVFSRRGEGSIMRETPRKGALLSRVRPWSYRAPEEHFENEPITICVRLSRLRYPIRIIAAREITCKL